MEQDTIGFISGTGPQGRGLAMRFALAGFSVWIGSREKTKADLVASELNGILEKNGKTFTPVSAEANEAVVSVCRYVLLTVPYENAEQVLNSYAKAMKPETVFVDVTVPLAFGKGDVQVIVPPEGSGSKALREILPQTIPFLAAFKTLPAHVLEDISMPLNCDTFVFGDNKEAKEKFISLFDKMGDLRPLDVGGLSAAATVEGMTALVIRINRKMKSKEARFKVMGA